ncbi:hypothetical protein EOPP23_21075 [Endozoicomonas sp. OPT23]|uniref:AsmA family protein n=1 Tax=Endozoicomonas sp. OPT23 TaxID=2072845 RepID=UPI00129A2004|nr:AsmA family protein [Endozoicomonas sp. OPT23]MRI35457.1 hypothetical protein [Endozoicomonas sp. OPT23]
MNRILKLFASILAGLVVITVAAALILPKVIDPNDYRSDISKAVHDSTGLQLAIDGPISWSVFPWLGLSLEDVNVKGSDNSQLAKLGAAEVNVKLLPLLGMKVEVKTAHLKGLELDLVKNKDGRGNWEAPAAVTTASAPKPAEKSEPASGSAPALNLDISSVSVEGLVLRYKDLTSGQSYTIDQAGLETGAIRSAQPFDFNLQARVNSKQDKLTLMTQVSGMLTVDLNNGKFALNKLKASATPAGKNSETLQLTGQFDVNQTPLKVSGSLNVTEFNPGKLLKQLNVELPAMANEKAMSSLSFNSHFSTDGKSFNADKLDLTLDAFNINGHFKVLDLEKQNMVFQFKGNELNLDHYLPPAAQPVAASEQSSEQKTETAKASGSSSTPAKASASAKEQPLIPEAMLRSLNIKGSLELAALTVAKLTFDKPTVEINAANARDRVKLTSGFYQGTISLNTLVDVRTVGTPKIDTNAALKGINLPSLATVIPALKTVEGDVNADLNVATRGQLLSVLTRNLNGKVDFGIAKGAFTEANFDKMVCEGIAKVRNKKLTKTDWGQATHFTRLGGSFVIRNGVASNKDLAAALSNLSLKGDGDVDLVNRKLDYHLGLNISGSSSENSDPECQVNEDYRDVTWPVRCHGVIGQQQCGIDTERLGNTIAALLKQEAKKRIEKELEDKAGPLKDVLKGLFK